MSDPSTTTTAADVRRRTPLLVALVLLLVAAYGLWIAIKWTTMRVYVPHNKALLVINKYGDPLPPDRIVAPKEQPTTFKGVQEDVLGPGRYWWFILLDRDSNGVPDGPSFDLVVTDVS